MKGLINAIADGLRSPTLAAELDELESRKATIMEELDAAPPPRHDCIRT